MLKKKNARPMLVRNLKERDKLGDLGLDGREILEWILKELGVNLSRWSLVTIPSEQDNERLGSTKRR
jgi:hypothetical protein